MEEYSCQVMYQVVPHCSSSWGQNSGINFKKEISGINVTLRQCVICDYRQFSWRKWLKSVTTTSVLDRCSNLRILTIFKNLRGRHISRRFHNILAVYGNVTFRSALITVLMFRTTFVRFEKFKSMKATLVYACLECYNAISIIFIDLIATPCYIRN